MSDPPKPGDAGPISRRNFIAASTAATVSASSLATWARAVQPAPRAVAGRTTALRVPLDRPLDLYIDRKPMDVAGKSTRQAITINGMLPGPTLRMREGQNVVIRVHNGLRDEDTSIHWHGLIVPMNMDGVPGVSFAGIKPGEMFEYRFPITPQNGTYWYHSHSGLQEQLGHYGALIVEPAEPDPFTYDVEHTVILSDWTYENPYRLLEKIKTINGYSNYQRQSVADLMQRADREGWGKTLGARLEFDKMRMDQTDNADITGAIMTYLMNGQSPAENWTAVAKPGQRVRLRLINAATTTFFDFRIPGLPMTVVMADGQYVKPVETDELRISVAETYDVLVTLPDDRAYTMFAETMDRSGHARGTLASTAGLSAAVPPKRERPLLGMIDMGMAGMGGGGMDGMKGMDDKPMTPSTGASDMKEMDGMDGMDGMAPKPAAIDSMPGMSDMPGMDAEPAAPSGGGLPTENLPMSFKHNDDTHGRDNSQVAMVAQRRFAEPGNGLGKDGWRVLTYADLRSLRPHSDRRAPDREFDLHLTGNMTRFIWGMDGKKFSDADMIRFKYGERVRMNMINDTMMSHPMHLHGMWMDLYAGGTLADNPRKHTVAVKPGELLTVDITVDAPGHWAFHCHLLYHMDAGMFRTVAVVRSLDERASK